MALSATFTANFASFYDAVDKADAKLKDFGAGADKVGGRLTALTNSFSGVKIVQDATLMVKAVEEIGGVTKLTEKELARLGATANEAVAKMKALGMDVPKNLQQIADQTKGANKATTDWLGTIGKMAAAFGIAFSISTITRFIGSVFDAASAVKDLSDQWGVSTKAVQQWTGAAKASGVATESVGKSVQFLTENLAEGSAQYKALLANVGLSYDQLRKMPLEDAYRLVVQAIAGIKDETLQLDVAQGLLGKSAKQMVGAIRDGFLDAAAAQKFMSDETIKRLEAAQAQWEKFKNAVVTYTGEMLRETLSRTEVIFSSWKNFFTFAGKLATDIPRFKDTAGEWVQGQQRAAAQANDSARALAGLNTELNKHTAATRGADDAVDVYAGDLGALTSQGAALTSGIKTQAQVTADLEAKEKALKKAQADRAAAQVIHTREQEVYNKAIQAHQDAVDDLVKTFAGGDLIGQANLYIEALKIAIPIEQMTAKEQAKINQVMDAAIDVYQAAGEMAPKVMYDIWLATTKAKEATEDLSHYLKDAFAAPINVGDLSAIQDAINEVGGGAVPPGLFDGMGKDLASALSSSVLKAIQGGGNLFQAAGSTIGNYLLDPKQSGVGKKIEEAASKLPGLLGGAISSAIPVVGAFIGPAIGWLANKISGWFGKKEHEKLRDSFIQAAGGMKVLSDAAKAAGVDLDELMRARNTDKVKAAIGELEAAFQFQATALDAAMEAATRYGFTLEELGPALARQELEKQAQQLYKDFQVLNSAGLESVAITERMAESVNAYVNQAVAMGVEIPSAMRPMLESFARAGTLVDANGEAITDLEAAGISFALTMSDGFKALITEVRTLTDAIARSLNVAIKEIPQPKVTGKVTWEVEPISRPHESAGGEALESYARGTEGFKNFGRGTPVVLHGWEAVVPRETSGAFATVSPGAAAPAAAAMPTIIVNAQGAFFDTPESLQRLATKVSDALTAKYSVMGRLRAAV